MAVPTRLEKYREAGKLFTSVALDREIVSALDAIAAKRGLSRNRAMEDAIGLYVKHFPSVERAQAIEQALMYGDVEALKSLQDDETDAEYAVRLRVAERTWRDYRLGRTAGTAVLRSAAEKASLS